MRPSFCTGLSSLSILCIHLAMFFSAITILSTWLGTAMAVVLAYDTAEERACRSLPGDTTWPSQSVWDQLNQTVGGNLLKGVPLGQLCHKPHMDSGKCSQIQEQWLL